MEVLSFKLCFDVWPVSTNEMCLKSTLLWSLWVLNVSLDLSLSLVAFVIWLALSDSCSFCFVKDWAFLRIVFSESLLE